MNKLAMHALQSVLQNHAIITISYNYFSDKTFRSGIKIIKVVLCRNSYCNTIAIGQSSFIILATRMVRPLLKLHEALRLVSNACTTAWLNGFYCEMNGKYSVTLLFFRSKSRRASLLRPRPSI